MHDKLLNAKISQEIKKEKEEKVENKLSTV